MNQKVMKCGQMRAAVLMVAICGRGRVVGWCRTIEL